MKTSSISSGILILLLIMLASSPQGYVVAQDQNTIPTGHDVKGTFSLTLQQQGLQMTSSPRLTLNNFGKGLQYYKCLILQEPNKKYLSNKQDNEKSIMVKSGFAELEMETLKQNMLFINKECQAQIKEWMRKETWDIHLEETIKGIYQTPVF